MKQSRFKSKAAWLTVGAAVVNMLVGFGVIDTTQGEAISIAVSAIATVLTVFGIFNNPENKVGF